MLIIDFPSRDICTFPCWWKIHLIGGRTRAIAIRWTEIEEMEEKLVTNFGWCFNSNVASILFAVSSCGEKIIILSFEHFYWTTDQSPNGLERTGRVGQIY